MPEQPKTNPPELELQRKRAISVRQHVEDEKQPDNPDAKFLSDKANKVAEETQARITSTDEDHPQPKAGSGSPDQKPTEQPGNAEETKVASSLGDSDEGSALPPPKVEEPTEQPPVAAKVEVQPSEEARRVQQAPQSPPAPEPPQQRTRPAAPQDNPRPPDAEPLRVPSVTDAPQGADSFVTPVAPKPKKSLPAAPPSKDLSGTLGLGSTSRTKSGVALNLSHQGALAVIGEKQLREDRRMDQLRRRSKRAGNWRMVGIERWRSAIENYVPMVKPGNTTALNTARSPFAVYLNDVHNRIHPIFADTFLVSLDQLPSSHPLNVPDLVTHAEIVLSSLDGSLVKAGIVKSSGVTAFDVNALEAVLHASPFGQPPAVIVSFDGNVYLHWEFYRNPYYACSTYFAHPYLLKATPNELPGPRVPR